MRTVRSSIKHYLANSVCLACETCIGVCMCVLDIPSVVAITEAVGPSPAFVEARIVQSYVVDGKNSLIVIFSITFNLISKLSLLLLLQAKV